MALERRGPLWRASSPNAKWRAARQISRPCGVVLSKQCHRHRSATGKCPGIVRMLSVGPARTVWFGEQGMNKPTRPSSIACSMGEVWTQFQPLGLWKRSREGNQVRCLRSVRWLYVGGGGDHSGDLRDTGYERSQRPGADSERPRQGQHGPAGRGGAGRPGIPGPVPRATGRLFRSEYQYRLHTRSVPGRQRKRPHRSWHGGGDPRRHSGVAASECSWLPAGKLPDAGSVRLDPHGREHPEQCLRGLPSYSFRQPLGPKRRPRRSP